VEEEMQGIILDGRAFRDENGAGFPSRETTHDEFQGIGEQNENASIRGDPVLEQVGRQQVGGGIHIGVGGFGGVLGVRVGSAGDSRRVLGGF
jgi:hypothetical protein